MKADIKTFHFLTLARVFTLALLLFIGSTSFAQDDKGRVFFSGVVMQKFVDKNTGETTYEPIFSVNMSDRGRLIGTTDEGGRFGFKIKDGTTLKLTCVGFEDKNVKFRLSHPQDTIFLENKDKELGLTTVRPKPKGFAKKAKVKRRGEFLDFPAFFTTPEFLATNHRMVVQIVAENVDTKERIPINAFVFDNPEYHLTQERMYGFELDEGDPLAKQITTQSPEIMIKRETEFDKTNYDNKKQIRQAKKKLKIQRYSFGDSVTIHAPEESLYRLIAYQCVEDYKDTIFCDTTEFGRGPIDPLRHLRFEFDGVHLTDTIFYPKPTQEPLDSKDGLNVHFGKDEADLNLNDSTNAAEMDKLFKVIQNIRNTPNSYIESIKIFSTSSPDGVYKNNIELSRKRLKSVFNLVLQQLDAQTRDRISTDRNATEASVAGWEEVEKALRADSLIGKADTLKGIIEQYSNIDQQSQRIKRLNFYYDLIVPEYLPRLRKVGYEMKYEILRPRTLAEIREVYRTDDTHMRRYEFFVLYRAEENDSLREIQLRRALERDPHDAIAACDLQELLISKKRPELNLLKPFIGDKRVRVATPAGVRALRYPMEINMNHVIACLMKKKYAEADSIAAYLPDDYKTEMVKSTAALLNGRYDNEDCEIVGSTSTHNKVVILLMNEDNKEALKYAKELPEDAISHYLRAVAYNRNGDNNTGQDELYKAIKLDRSFITVAQRDGESNVMLRPEHRLQFKEDTVVDDM